MAYNQIDQSFFTYERDATTSYLVLKVDRMEKIISHQVEMISNNLIPSILPIHTRVKNNETFLYYNVTSKQNLSQALKRKKLTRDEFLRVLEGMSKGILESSNYFLSDKAFLIDAEYIYVNPEDYQIYFVYLPITLLDYNLQNPIKTLVNLLIAHINPTENLEDHIIHRVLMAVNDEDFNVKEFNKLIIELQNNSWSRSFNSTSQKDKEEIRLKNTHSDSICIKDEEGNQSYKAKTPENCLEGLYSKKVFPLKYKLIVVLYQLLIMVMGLIIGIEMGVFKAETFEITTLLGIVILIATAEYFFFARILTKEKRVEKKIAKAEKEEKKKSRFLNYNMNKKEILSQPSINSRLLMEGINDSTDVIIDSLSNDTMIIDADSYTNPYLTAVKDGTIEKIVISKSSFIIGKLKDQVDYLLMYKSISRIHAEISRVEGRYYIKDLNSKNGTFVNGNRIDSNKEYLLEDGTYVKFADREFLFRQD